MVGWHMALCKQEDFAKCHFFIIFRLYFIILHSVKTVGSLSWTYCSVRMQYDLLFLQLFFTSNSNLKESCGLSKQALQPDCKKKQKIVIMKQMAGTMKKFIVWVQKAADLLCKIELHTYNKKLMVWSANKIGWIARLSYLLTKIGLGQNHYQNSISWYWLILLWKVNTDLQYNIDFQI